MATQIMTSKQLVERLKVLAARNTLYWNQYPYNLCYIHNNGKTSADCVNLYKSLLNGYDVTVKRPGYFQSDLRNTGDVDEWGLMAQCSDVSQNFGKLKAGEPRLLYLPGHIGGYIGENVVINGKTYNCIECTGAWGGGILYSYVDGNGSRFNHKGGSMNGRWTHNGKMTPWVKYVGGKDEPKKSNKVIAQEVIDGKWGTGEDRRIALEAAGYNYRTIQDLVNEMVKKKDDKKKSNKVIAQEVIDGKWGVGEDRKKKLEAAGYNYRTIQDLVNEMVKTWKVGDKVTISGVYESSESDKKLTPTITKGVINKIMNKVKNPYLIATTDGKIIGWTNEKYMK